MPLPFQHLISAEQLTPETISAVFSVADEMDKIWTSGTRSKLLEEKIVALLFYEPSSRTMLSFQAAAQGLTAGTILAHGRQNSSMQKGETVEDTIRMVARYSDLIVMRHPDAGSAEQAANVSHVPFVNAGDGGNQHPTQALLDVYTIQQKKGRLENLHIAFACDPKQSRTIRSLAMVMSQYAGSRFTFIGPESLRASRDLLDILDERGVPYEEAYSLEAGLDADILYMNRLQEERFEDPKEFEKYRKQFILTADMVQGKEVLVMDPLPRIDEIHTSVDSLPNAAYFDQARNGVITRMALLAMLLGKA